MRSRSLRDAAGVVGGVASLLATGAAAQEVQPENVVTEAAQEVPARTAIDVLRELESRIERWTLPNGLQVVVAPGPERRTATACVGYDVGAADDPEGYQQLAHLTEHVMFGATAHAPSAHEVLAGLGVAEYNALTFAGATWFYERFPANALERVLWLESERLGYLLGGLDGAEVDRQRAVVARELRDRADASVLRGFHRAIAEELWPEGHPNRRLGSCSDAAQSSLARASDLDAIGLPEVQWFHQNHYRPDAAILAITGAVDPARARGFVERYFAPLRASGEPREAQHPPLLPTLSHEVRVEYESLSYARLLTVQWITPHSYAEGDGELDVIAALLTEGPRARLGSLVTAGLGPARATQASDRLGSTFVIEVPLAEGVNVADVLSQVDSVLRSLAETEVAEEELAAARASWVAAPLRWLGDPTLRACGLAERGADGRAVRLGDHVARYQRITSEDVRVAAARWLPLDRRVVASVAPSRHVSGDGRVASRRVVPAEGAR